METSRKLKRRGPYTDRAIVDAIDALVFATGGRMSAREIHAWLERQPEFNGRVPTVRTVQNIIRARAAADDSSGPWHADSSLIGEGAAVAAALGEAIRLTGGRVTSLTNLQAETIARLSRVAPDLDPRTLFLLASAYLTFDRTGQDKGPLDAFLAFAPWRDDGREKVYQEAIDKGWVSLPPGYITHSWQLRKLGIGYRLIGGE